MKAGQQCWRGELERASRPRPSPLTYPHRLPLQLPLVTTSWWIVAGREPVDTWRVRFVAPQRPSGGARWAHTFPHGTGGGLSGTAVIPDAMDTGRRQGHTDNVLTRIHNASLWVNLFGNSHPVVGPSVSLPEADAADLPPVVAQGRPSVTHAYYQSLMAAGIGLGITMGQVKTTRPSVTRPANYSYRRDGYSRA